jgi:penicillin-binding protein 1C
MLTQLMIYRSNLKKEIRWWRNRTVLFFLSVFLIWYVDCLPDQLFDDSTSTVLLDRNGQLLGAHISEDEQWRFEELKKVPYKFKTCIIQFEDRGFYDHWGVSAKGVGRAVSQNLQAGRRVSGGSTLTMQLVRLSRKNPPRTYSEKAYEMILATRIEFSYSKSEILRLYSSHAPFGSNVVGLNAASWRFFGRPPNELSWAESATLAVLPNAPGLIYPGKNHDKLKVKRDRLLKRLLKIGKLDKMQYKMAVLEPLPDRPQNLPNLAPHLLTKCLLSGLRGKTTTCTLDRKVQIKANQLLETRTAALRENEVHNGAIIITSVETGEILAYVGNATESGNEHSNRVNCIDAPRSTGSILKPVLYAKSLEAGVITPKMLLHDIPSKFGAFAPKNFNGNFNGLVHADKALSRSLNIPMVHLVNNYGISKFHSDLQDLGFSTINKTARHYGLSLILGGAEVTLFDLSNFYTRMAQHLKYNESYPIHYKGKRKSAGEFLIDRACIFSTFNTMLEVRRPDEDNNWRMFASSQKIAWKTGTSYGFRDAWAVGVTPEYVVSVWVGNADGEGRPGLTGIQAAAPLLFDMFDHLPSNEPWFLEPKKRMREVEICSESGHRATQYCTKTSMDRIPETAIGARACPYHKRVHLDKAGMYRVDSECASPSEMQHVNRFVIPSTVEKFYKIHNAEYKTLPPYNKECMTKLSEHSIAIIYPRNKQRIYLPFDFNEERRKVVFEANHRNNSETIYWHMDGVYYGQTSDIHQLEFQPDVGKHKLTLMDENGVQKVVMFEVLGK